MPEEQFSDDEETIRVASEKSGAKKMLEDLARRMRSGQGDVRPKSIEDFYVKSNAEIPEASKKVAAALAVYAAKVSSKKKYYSAIDRKWYSFEFGDRELNQTIEKIQHKIRKLFEIPPKDVETFNLVIQLTLKNMILGGIVEESDSNKIMEVSQSIKGVKRELYHITFKIGKSVILKEGIRPQAKSTYHGAFGQMIKEFGKIYAFSNFDDAVRWASRLQYDSGDPTAIVVFRGDPMEWERDMHFESAGSKGMWLKKKGSVEPADIIEVIDITPDMTRAVVQTLGMNKELTRRHGIVEKGKI